MTLKRHAHWVNSVCALNDGRLASASSDTVQVWSLLTGGCEFTLEGYTDVVRSVCELRNDRLASASVDKTIRVWRISVEGHTDWVMSVCELSDVGICIVQNSSSMAVSACLAIKENLCGL